MSNGVLLSRLLCGSGLSRNDEIKVCRIGALLIPEPPIRLGIPVVQTTNRPSNDKLKETFVATSCWRLSQGLTPAKCPAVSSPPTNKCLPCWLGGVLRLPDGQAVGDRVLESDEEANCGRMSVIHANGAEQMPWERSKENAYFTEILRRVET